MKVLYVCTELYPLLKTGGLADVGAALPAALRAAGCDVRLLLPAFPSISAGVRRHGAAIPLPATGGPVVVPLLARAPVLTPGRVTVGGQPVYLLDAPELYDRAGGPYLDGAGREWPDNAARFGLFGWAAAWLGMGGDPDWQPDVVHVHDWHAGLAPVYMQLLGRGHAVPASVFTIHNLAYQGVFPADTLASLDLPYDLFHVDGIEFHGQLSFMKAGLRFSDAITTVSPRYAREIMTPEQGCGFEGLLRTRSRDVTGILNGVDYDVWNPAHDASLDAPFDHDQLAGKVRAKRALQAELGLHKRPGALVFGVVSRLIEQKGLHLVPDILDDLVARGGQLVVLGSGDAAVEASLAEAIARHPGQAVLRSGYDERLAHRIFGGADVVLVPSRFEPCGLTQLYGLRYGALPLVHAVGGLADTVHDSSLENLEDGSASGFVFDAFGVEGLRRAMHRAFALHRRRRDWLAVQRQAMQLRFDWKDAAGAYHRVYTQLLSRREGVNP